MPTSGEPLSAGEIAAIDAAYEPFPPFSDWPRVTPHLDAWQGRQRELEEVVASGSREQLARARETAVRAAAFDTGAIEGLYETSRGLTRTIAEQAAAWEQKLREEAPEAAPFFEAQLKTYELVLDGATRSVPVSEAWIRRLHEELTEAQETYTVHTPVGSQEQPLPRGEYKRYPNHVELADGSMHSYAPVGSTSPEMARLVSELNSDVMAVAHPILQASYAHYALVAVHPFADGNGRVARALASTYFYRAASVPVLILADQRDDYFARLRSADLGDPLPFVTFIGDAGRAAMGMVAESMREAAGPRAADALGDLRQLLTAQGGLTHADLDTIAGRLSQDLLGIVNHETGGLDLVAGLTVQPVNGSGEAMPAPRGFRHIISGGARYVQIDLQSVPPAAAIRRPQIALFVSVARDEAETFLLQPTEPHAGLTLGLREAHPALALSAQQRMSSLIRRILGAELRELHREAAVQLRAGGYTSDQ